MKTELLTQLWSQHQQIIQAALSKLNDENRKNRLIAETASVGFIALHMAETMLFFSGFLFKSLVDFRPLTLRMTDEGHDIELNQINNLMQRAMATLTNGFSGLTDEQWDEVLQSPFGELTRQQGLVRLMHHNSHHIGQIVQAMKKGKEFVL
ncbi:DinB family protein [Spirosoma endbachense]|uniref:DUF1572 domain-containing protein n=1 Tax=Spirosoma endbachense TaxID=2666025 RepID=A0A6P1W4F1_9BACT|nr:DinB family protein [Spirosoma endbachense]QHV98810.1 DUF1572 domain-containing protein [Spirosoma endbachense]